MAMADRSSDDSNGSDIESCFDTENEESDLDTNPTNVDTDVEEDSGADISWLFDENKDHSHLESLVESVNEGWNNSILSPRLVHNLTMLRDSAERRSRKISSKGLNLSWAILLSSWPRTTCTSRF
ncbi:hypothetical protein GP486_005092 [Trichoglossum hirsutum]|uniref:Uncharacterized protein n=1 Tax=Trichoglossum hirsutum TaxID=265104 RepID=A0A9P8L9R6_9PEZI|nr:hypothetical protein GP486_005092 [Trichoglossum hirsutum]